MEKLKKHLWLARISHEGSQDSVRIQEFIAVTEITEPENTFGMKFSFMDKGSECKV